MRKDNWPEILAKKLVEHETTKFKYGTCDCWLFSMDVADAMLGTNYKADGFGKYKTWKGALRLMQKTYDVKTAEEMASRLFTYIQVNRAGRGDIVMLNGSFGVCDGAYSLFKSLDGTLVQQATINCQNAWRVE